MRNWDIDAKWRLVPPHSVWKMGIKDDAALDPSVGSYSELDHDLDFMIHKSLYLKKSFHDTLDLDINPQFLLIDHFLP